MIAPDQQPVHQKVHIFISNLFAYHISHLYINAHTNNIESEVKYYSYEYISCLSKLMSLQGVLGYQVLTVSIV